MGILWFLKRKILTKSTITSILSFFIVWRSLCRKKIRCSEVFNGFTFLMFILISLLLFSSSYSVACKFSFRSSLSHNLSLTSFIRNLFWLLHKFFIIFSSRVAMAWHLFLKLLFLILFFYLFIFFFLEIF